MNRINTNKLNCFNNIDYQKSLIKCKYYRSNVHNLFLALCEYDISHVCLEYDLYLIYSAKKKTLNLHRNLFIYAGFLKSSALQLEEFKNCEKSMRLRK